MGYGKEVDYLSELEVPDDLKETFKKERFYWDDSGLKDPERIVMFATVNNFVLLQEYRDWLMDGTFEILNKKFKQLYTIHIVINGKDVPLVYCCLFKKNEKKYNKMFKMIACAIKKPPISICIDFEKANKITFKVITFNKVIMRFDFSVIFF